jgi:hypothetical protein
MPKVQQKRLELLKTGIIALKRVYMMAAEFPDLLEFEIRYEGHITGPAGAHKPDPIDPHGTVTIYPLQNGKRIWGVSSTNKKSVARIDLAEDIAEYFSKPIIPGGLNAPSGYGTGKFGKHEMDKKTYEGIWREATERIENVMARELV